MRNSLSLRQFNTVLGTTLLAILYASAVEAATDDVVTNTREILYTASADKNNRVFLEVMTLTADVGGDFEAVGKTHTAYLSHCRVRLLRGRSVNTGAHAALLRALLEGRNGTLAALLGTRLAHKLVDGGHSTVMLLPCLLSK